MYTLLEFIVVAIQLVAPCRRYGSAPQRIVGAGFPASAQEEGASARRTSTLSFRGGREPAYHVRSARCRCRGAEFRNKRVRLSQSVAKFVAKALRRSRFLNGEVRRLLKRDLSSVNQQLNDIAQESISLRIPVNVALWLSRGTAAVEADGRTALDHLQQCRRLGTCPPPTEPE